MKHFNTLLFVALLPLALLAAPDVNTRDAMTRAARTFKVGSGTQYADINAAMEDNNVLDGDILEVTPGTVMQGAQQIYKRVTIAGPGWKVNNNGDLETGCAKFQSHVYVLGDGEGATITGMVFERTPVSGGLSATYLYVEADDITISKCLIDDYISLPGEDYFVEGLTLKCNFIRNNINGVNVDCNSGWKIHHNIIETSSVGGPERFLTNIRYLNEATIDHNIIFNQSGTSSFCLNAVENSSISNNIIVKFSYATDTENGDSKYLLGGTMMSSGNKFSRNVFTGTLSIPDNRSGIVSRSNIFLYNGSFTPGYDECFRLKPSSLATGYASDGGDCGPWSGDEAYDGGGGGAVETVTPLSGFMNYLGPNYEDYNNGMESYFGSLLSLFKSIDACNIEKLKMEMTTTMVRINVKEATYEYDINAETLPVLQSLWTKRQLFQNVWNNAKSISKANGSKYALFGFFSDGATFNFKASGSTGISIDVVRGYVKELMNAMYLENITIKFNGEDLFEEPKQEVTEDLYTVTLPESPIKYDGLPHPAQVKVAEGVGTPTLYYAAKLSTGTGYAWLTTEAPVEVGEYDVYLEIAEGKKYLAMERTLVGVIDIVSGTLLGDANTDGEVNVLDAQWTLRYILAPAQTSPFSFENANTFAKDQVINVQDIVCTVNIFMGQSLAAAKRRELGRQPVGKATGTAAASYGDGEEDGQGAGGDVAVVRAAGAAVTVIAGEVPVAAIDMEIEGVRPDEVSLALPRTDFQMITRATETSTRVVIISLTGRNIVEAGETQTMLVTSSMARPSAAMAASPMAEEVKVTIDATDGIDVVNSEQRKDNNGDAIFNLAGQRLAQPRRGVNIVGGRKVIVR